MRVLPELDSQLEAEVSALSELILSNGLAPIFINLFDANEKQLFSDLTPAFKKVEVPKIRTDLGYSEEETKLIYYLEAASKKIHLRLLSDRNFFFKKVSERNRDLEQCLLRDKDGWGLIKTHLMKPGLQWFEFHKSEVHLHQTLIGTTNSHLWLAHLLSGVISKDVFVRPDPLRVRSLGSSQQYMERASAYGKPFNVKWLKDLKKVEIAEHFPNFDNVLNRGHRTQFIWEPLDGGKVQFAIEELPEDMDFSGRVCTRFIHGIFDKSSEIFEHFDGAIHIYNSAGFSIRQSKTLKDHFNQYDKAKIFLIDSGLDLTQSQKLITAFYRWNPLPSEYFAN